MSVNTGNIVCIRHSLINIIDRIKICMAMIRVTQFSPAKNIRCIHRIQNQYRKNKISQPDDPFSVTSRNRNFLIHPCKYKQFCKKQNNSKYKGLCMPSILSGYRSDLLHLVCHADDPKRNLRKKQHGKQKFLPCRISVRITLFLLHSSGNTHSCQKHQAKQNQCKTIDQNMAVSQFTDLFQ